MRSRTLQRIWLSLGKLEVKMAEGGDLDLGIELRRLTHGSVEEGKPGKKCWAGSGVAVFATWDD